MGCNCSKSPKEPEVAQPASNGLSMPSQIAPIADAVTEKATDLYNQISTAVITATSPTEGTENHPGAADRIQGAMTNLIADMSAGLAGATAAPKKKKKNRRKKAAANGKEENSSIGDESVDAAMATGGTVFFEPVEEPAVNQSVAEAYYSADSEDPHLMEAADVDAKETAAPAVATNGGGKKKKKGGNR